MKPQKGTLFETTTILQVREKIRLEHEKTHSWKLVGENIGIKKGTAFRIATDENYEPKDFEIRKVLHLPLVAMVIPVAEDIPYGSQALYARICLCGQWFIPNSGNRKRCFICTPFRKRKERESVSAKDLFDMPKHTLLWKLENRELVKL